MSPPPPPDDRDELKRKTPPAGVQEQLARPVAKSRAATPVDGIEFDREPTGVQQMPRAHSETPTQTLLRRSAQTKNKAIDLQDGLDALRVDHTTLATKVGGVETKVDISIGQNERMLGMLIAVKEKKELAEIDETAKNNEALRIQKAKNSEELRKWLVKLGAIALTLVMGLVVALIALTKDCSGG